jgi:hypothetical protein
MMNTVEKMVINEEQFNAEVKGENAIRTTVESAISAFIESEFGELLEGFECFLKIDRNGVSLVSCG